MDFYAAAEASGGASASKPVFLLSQITTQLRTQWGGSQEGKTWSWVGTNNITYSMPDAGPSGQSESGGYQQMTPLMKQQARLAFELWDDVVAISLTESVNNTNANITFNYSSNTDGNGTYAYWNGRYAPDGNFDIERAYIWLNSGWSSHDQDSDLFFGGYGIETYLHEIGHTLGLSHAGTYNAGSGGTLSYSASAEYFQDSGKYTVMSYWRADAAEAVDHYGQSGSWRYASTPLLHDVAALQAAYGADTTTRTGNTTYGFNSNADRAVFDFSVNRDPILCIWDAGGTDTLDCSGYTTNQYLNLTPGTFSDVGSMTDNVSIAFGAIIENAVGGAGNDILIGNAANNVLSGGSGVDTYAFSAGGWGLDTIVDTSGNIVFTGIADVYSLFGQFTGSATGAGYELIYAGNGSTILFEGLSSLLGWTFGYSANADFTGVWTTVSFDDLVQSGGSRTITGGSSKDILRGSVGDDVLDGAANADRLMGAAGNDIYVVDNKGDIVDETNGAGVDAGGFDTVRSSIAFSLSSAKTVRGTVEAVELTGASHINATGDALSNTITGNAGNNVLTGLGGADVLDGAGGRDTASYASSDAGVVVSLATGIGGGGHAQGDTLAFIEDVIGSAFNDTLEGDAGNNILNGGSNRAGGDTVSYANASAAVAVSLATSKAQNTIGAGTDTLIAFENLTGSRFADTLTGNSAGNVLTGGDGADILDGGLGADTLIGDGGVDVFLFRELKASKPSASDLVMDFEAGVDRIDLSAIDANKRVSGNQDFVFGGQNDLALSYSVTWSEVAGNTIVQADTDGKSGADFRIVLSGVNLGLQSSDFVL